MKTIMLRMMALVFLSALAWSPAMADTETHAIGVYDGFTRSGNRIHGPQAIVTVDRPGVDVTLLLGSYEPVRWYLQPSDGTRIAKVIVHGRGMERSEVYVEDDLFANVVRIDLAATYENRGRDYRNFLRNAPAAVGVDQFNSFAGSYIATTSGFLIDAATRGDTTLAIDPLRSLVASASVVPAALRPYLPPPAGQSLGPDFSVVLTDEGFVLQSGDAPDEPDAIIPVTLDVPQIGWSVGAGRDPKTGILYGVSGRGEGYIYRYEPTVASWSILTSMDEIDAGGMVFDTENDRLLIFGNRPSDVYEPLLVLVSLAGTKTVVPLVSSQFPGLDDFVDIEGGPGPHVVPIAVAGNQLLLRAGVDIFGRQGTEQARAGQKPLPFRLYLFDIDTEAVRLLAYASEDGASSVP